MAQVQFSMHIDDALLAKIRAAATLIDMAPSGYMKQAAIEKMEREQKGKAKP